MEDGTGVQSVAGKFVGKQHRYGRMGQGTGPASVSHFLGLGRQATGVRPGKAEYCLILTVWLQLVKIRCAGGQNYLTRQLRRFDLRLSQAISLFEVDFGIE